MSEERFAKTLIFKSRKIKHSVFEERKKKLFSDITGVVLEIGPGAGTNLQFYPKTIRWIGVEPNRFFHPYLNEQIVKFGIENWALETGGAERLPVPDNSVDAVVSTQVFCSVSDVPQAVSEIKRVLKPGGKLYFLEHVAARQGTFLRWWQNCFNPWSRRFGCGCHLNRETLPAIQAAGFASVMSESFTLGRFFPLPMIIGTAQK